MTTLLMILGGCLVGLVIGLMNPTPPKKKPWKPKKKNFFVRLGESGNPKYNWMGGYTESD
jgi:hypothetical protein